MTVPRDRLLRRAAVAFAACCVELFAQAPSYSAAGIVNAASFQSGALAPNELATIFGQNLALGTAALSTSDIASGTLPFSLPSVNTSVMVGGVWGHVIYASPTQVNFLVPSNLLPGKHELRVMRGVFAGPAVMIDIVPASPGLFQLDAKTIIASHSDWSVVTAAAPAAPGEVVVLYATGLGATNPPQAPGVLAQFAAGVSDPATTPVYFSGIALPAGSVYYTGVTPGFAGLYQINLRIPGDAPNDPEVRVGVEGSQSPGGLILPVRKP